MTTRPVNRDAKSLLAKLMASENITVIHENIKVPFFNLKERSLHLPVWEKMSGDLYDFLVFHEVGHALETPAEGWHSALDLCFDKNHNHTRACFDMKFKGYLNVCEDARQEKLQKRRFEGAKQCFAAAYREIFWERDYFRVRDLHDKSQLPFIDRVNLHTKMGSMCPVTFNAEEQVLVDELLAVETFADMVVIARKIYELAGKQKPQIDDFDALTDAIKEELKKAIEESQKADPTDQKPSQSEDSDPSDPSDGGEDEDFTESSESTTGSGDEDNETEDNDEDDSAGGSGDDGKDEDDTGEEDDKTETSAGGDDGEDEDVDDTTEEDESKTDEAPDEAGKNNEPGDKGEENEPAKSLTDEAYRQGEEMLVSKSTTSMVLNLVLQNFDVRKTKKFVSIPMILKKFEGTLKHEIKDYTNLAHEIHRLILKQNKAQIDTLIAEFNRRKNAAQYLRTRETKSGELDMRKLNQYKFRSDLFRAFTTMPLGKNHGLIMYVDFSGSMNGLNMYKALEQTIMLVNFCDRLNIPYEVYGFSDCSANGNFDCRDEWNTFQSNVRNLNLLGKQNTGITIDNGYGFNSYNNWHIIHLVSSADTVNKDRCMQMISLYCQYHAGANGVVEAAHDSNFFAEIANLRPSINCRISECGLALSGTPLNECMVASRGLIENFKSNHNVDIVNVIYLTDGMGNSAVFPKDIRDVLAVDRNNSWTGSYDIYITDEETHESVYVKGSYNEHLGTEEALIKLTKRITDARHMGFYVGRKSTIWNYLNMTISHTTNIESSPSANAAANAILQIAKQKLSEEGMLQMAILGFDSYYLYEFDIDDNDIQMDSNMGENTRNHDNNLNSKGLKRLQENFKKQMRRDKTRRFLLQQFANDLATVEGKNIAANNSFMRV